MKSLSTLFTKHFPGNCLFTKHLAGKECMYVSDPCPHWMVFLFVCMSVCWRPLAPRVKREGCPVAGPRSDKWTTLSNHWTTPGGGAKPKGSTNCGAIAQRAQPSSAQPGQNSTVHSTVHRPKHIQSVQYTVRHTVQYTVHSTVHSTVHRPKHTQTVQYTV